MRRALKVMVAGLAVSGACVASAAPAEATLGYANICPSLQTTLCTQQNVYIRSVTVDDSSGPSAGDVWLLAGNPQRLIEYDASGGQLGEFPLEDPESQGGGILGYVDIPNQVVISPVDGGVYVSSDEKERLEKGINPVAEITKLNPSGALQWQTTGSETPQGSFGFVAGMAIDSITDDIYVADIQREMIDMFTSEGKYIGQFPIAAGERNMGALAVNPAGDLYVGFEGQEPEANRNNGKFFTTQVKEYTSTGTPVDCPGTTDVVYESPPDTPESTTDGAVAVDPSNGHLFIAERSASQGGYIAEYTAPCTAPSGTFGEGEVSAGSSTFGVNASTHEVDTGFGQIFGLVPVPVARTGAPATNVTHFSANVSGTVNPEETSVTECEFEYGGSFAYGHSVPCAQAPPLEGSSPVAVSAKLTGLGPGLLYYYRVRVGTADSHRFSEDRSFTTEALSAPIVGGRPASNVSRFAATLNATIQTGEAIVNYHFEYGTSTAYGQVEPIPDEYTPITGETVPVTQSIDGLQAGTTYHYRLVVSSAGGTDVTGPDETFTTLSVPAPAVATGGASGVGVDSAALSGTADPHGWDTSYLVEYGTSSAYGSSWPTVPVELGALEGPQPVQVNVSNLLPGTTYHYRLVAVNGGGTSYGADMTFTTEEYPAQAVQEPLALRTLLVPGGAGSKTVSKKATKGKKKHKKAKKDTKAKRRKRGK